MNIRLYGAPDLEKKAEPVPKITDEIKALSGDMLEVMKKNNGIGLAAPQIGINKKIITMNFDAKSYEMSEIITPGEALLIPQMPLTLINPEITSFSNTLVSVEEGCLSVPEIYASVVRSSTVELKATLLNGEFISLECGGWLAIVLQHEIDHLNGIIFIDRLTKPELLKIKSKLNKLKKKISKKGYLK
ncbi:MAG TPA: peptide deformylase [Victivallales bacterium]|nr:peptide deformylase [Victivallales bacterium]